MAGHRQMAQLALQELKGEAREAFAHIRSQVVDASNSADRAKFLGRGNTRDHFVDMEALGLPDPDVEAPYADPDLSAQNRAQLLQALTQHPGAGDLPMAGARAYQALVAALRDGKPLPITQAAGDLLHFIADAHQPLHATQAHHGLGPWQEKIHWLMDALFPEKCADARPQKVQPLKSLESADMLLMGALLESHAWVSTVLAYNMGCDSGVCPPHHPRRGVFMKCQPVSRLVRQRLESAASMGTLLLTRAVMESRTPPSR